MVALAAPVAALAASNPVVSALQGTAAAKSSRIGISVSSLIQSRRVSTTGTAEQRGSSVHMKMKIGAGVLAMPMEGIEVVESGHVVVYLKTPALASMLPAGKTWLKIDLQRQGAVLGIDFAWLINGTPTQSPKILSTALASTRRLETTSIAGRAATRYHVVIDLDRAAAANPAARASINKLRQLTQTKRIPEDIWVGSDGRVSRLRMTSVVTTQGVKATSTTTLTYLAYDIPVTIKAPPASRVYQAP